MRCVVITRVSRHLMRFTNERPMLFGLISSDLPTVPVDGRSTDSRRRVLTSKSNPPTHLVLHLSKQYLYDRNKQKMCLWHR